MHPHIECPKSERLFKRSFSHSFDGCDSESLRPTKRHQQLPPTPPTPSHSLDKVLRSSCPQGATPSSPEPPRLSKKRAFEDADPAPNPLPEKSRLEGWLEEVPESPPTRASSCPPQLENSNPLQTIGVGEGQRLSFDVLQEMSQSQRPSLGAGSVGSCRSSRLTTSHPDYRTILHNNGVCIDHTGEKIPTELRSFLDAHILKERSSELSPEAIAAAAKTAVSMADDPEGNVYELADTVMLPIKRSDVGRGSNTPWYSDSLPRNKVYWMPLAAPKPDIHIGYATGRKSNWKVEENTVVDHEAARGFVKPAKGNSFPFFSMELKSEAMGGNLWQAENQAAGSGASSVNATCWLYREAYPSQNQPIVDTIAFSACITHRLIVFHVHFYSAEENQHYMSWIATCETMRQVQKSNHLVESIFEHCLGTRQQKIRDALAVLYPFPDRWKKSRPASVMDSQHPAADEDKACNKNQRTDHGS